MSKESTNMSPTKDMSSDVTQELCLQIGDLVSSKSGCFSCSGSIPMAVQPEPGSSSGSPPPAPAGAPSTEDITATTKAKPSATPSGGPNSDAKTASKPVTVRWDPPSAPRGECRSTCFPPWEGGSSGAEMAGLLALLQDCAPATFGRGDEDVLNESYRKASKLGASAFATDFCPYALGIVDTAAELLMPGVGIGASRAVTAELYKLNVYAAPSGHFKPHVDTPRSEQQFGSLVVCLPCAHEGGALVVRHAGRSVTYDWGTTDMEAAPAIRWAAFYSDCEHEVLEVTSGHRVTLTYNLYAVPRRVQLEGKTEGLDITSLPLFHAVKDALVNPRFLPNGGTVGCYCCHWYPHAAHSPKDAPMFPSILKGSDLYLYCVFVALGLEVTIQPLMERDKYMDECAGLNKDNVFVGKLGCGVGAVQTDMGGYDDEPLEETYHAFGRQEKVHWLNAPARSTRQVGFYHLTYGNEAGLGSRYTYAALLVSIRRNGDGAASANISATQ